MSDGGIEYEPDGDGAAARADEPVRPRLDTDVDPGADGRQHGHVVLPRRDGGFDRPRLPLTVLRRGDGPRLVLLGGADGERSGSLALRRLARELDPAALAGTVVIVPDAPRELLGALVDGLLDTPDLVLEMVGAPPGFGFSPAAGRGTGGEREAVARADAAMIAFGAPESVRFAPALAPGALEGALAANVPHVVVTPGGGVPLAEALDVALVGCRNVLVGAGALDAPLALRATRTLAVTRDDAFVHAPVDGLLEPRVRAGQSVHRGDPLAFVVDPTANGAAPVPVRVPRDGVVLGARTDARVRAGDCLAIVADETRG